MFYFRINRIRIRDNREAPAVLGLFGPDRAEVKIASIVTTDDLALPGLDRLARVKGAKEREKLLAAAARRVRGDKGDHGRRQRQGRPGHDLRRRRPTSCTRAAASRSSCTGPCSPWSPTAT